MLKYFYSISLWVLILVFNYDSNKLYSKNNEDSNTIISKKLHITKDIDTNISKDTLEISSLGEEELVLPVEFTSENLIQRIVPLPDDSLLQKRFDDLNKIMVLYYEYNPIIKDFLIFYLQKKPHILPGIITRSKKYFPMIEEILDNNDIPIEIKNLAIVESALIPYARSRMGAQGLWQFMYWTGKSMGLVVNSLVDERCDPVKSTEAACKYLNYLYKIYRDWYLVLAAYNSGQGNVNKAIRRSGGQRDFWKIRPFLPRETRAYVPGFMAVSYNMQYYKKDNLVSINPKETYFDVDTIHFNRKMTFEDVTNFINVPLEKIKEYNSIYRANIIPGSIEEPHILTLPKIYIDTLYEKRELFYAFVDSLNKNRKINIVITKNNTNNTKKNKAIFYKVKFGDVLSNIANRFGVKTADIKRWNKIRGYKIQTGQLLVLHIKNKNKKAI